MERNHKNIDLFLPSGCITEEGLFAYLDGQLDEVQQALLVSHMQGCELCSDALEGLRMLAGRKSAGAVHETVAGLKLKLDRKYNQASPETKDSKWLPRLVTIYAIAATILAFLGLYVVIRIYVPWQKQELAVYMPMEQNNLKKSDSIASLNQPPPPPPMELAENSVKPKLPAARYTAPAVTEADKIPSLANSDKSAESDFIVDRLKDKEKEITLEEKAKKSVPVKTFTKETTAKSADQVSSAGTSFALEKKSKDANFNVQHSAPAAAPQKFASEIEEKNPVYTVVEEMPSFPGGEKARLKFLQDNLQYPQNAKESGISGTVYVSFVITEKGKLEDARVMKGIGGGCDEEALRVIKMMPPWNSGRQAGKPVRVQFTMPIRFTLDSTKQGE